MPKTTHSFPENPLSAGLYDQLLDATLAQQMEALRHLQWEIHQGEVDSGESHTVLAQYLERVIGRVLDQLRGPEAIRNQLEVARRILDAIHDDAALKQDPAPELIQPLQRLLSVHPPGKKPPRPLSPLARSTLVTGARSDLKLGVELVKEIQSAERVDILCSFILWSGLRVILDALRELTSKPDLADAAPRLRVITTSYMGNTEVKALEQLLHLPQTEIKVNYDTKHGRLHAKAYLIHRPTGFGSAYIGSANLSKSALSEGLEWTTKISQFELPYLWQKVTQTFNGYWLDGEFDRLTEAKLPQLRVILNQEREAGSAGNAFPTFFDINPHPFQQEILDDLREERARGKNRHLIIAATGTGKTMIAAFDYRDFARESNRRPSLLFIAHRREILEQALHTFRSILRDQNFGDLVAGGEEETISDHLFCVINSYNSRGLNHLPQDRFDYIVVDEFHHAAADSYQKLLEHVRPQVLLGLTATPERHDQQDILHWFGGRASAEIRLPDAICRDFLVAFQYFGVTDSVDYSQLNWQRGGYRLEDLEKVLSTNAIRAGLVVDKVHEILLDPHAARALGFCVSIAHAEFMAQYFISLNLRAAVLSSHSSSEEREAMRDKLRSREINFLFVVDLYNEGVDIPEIDTVLFLRPTESLTVFLQQLGRGLRKYPGKQCLTVLDFVGAHRKEYRFASRFRALLADRGSNLKGEIENDFTSLPPGCFIRLERVARERILRNIESTIGSTRSSILAGLREYQEIHGRVPEMLDAAEFFGIHLASLCRRGLWARLLADSGLGTSFEMPNDLENEFAAGLHRGSHWDDAAGIATLLHYLDHDLKVLDNDQSGRILISQFLATLLGKRGISLSLDQADTLLRGYPAVLSSVRALLVSLQFHSHPGHRPLGQMNSPLMLHCQYSLAEILIGLGHWTFENRPAFREGVLHLERDRLDVFFVTLKKTEKDYSPTTLYEDYAISPSEFHWQTQRPTTVKSPTGQRYIHHKRMGYTPLLFVRESKKQDGRTMPYYFLGPCEYLRHQGDRPISITWRLVTPMPTRLFRLVALEGVG